MNFGHFLLSAIAALTLFTRTSILHTTNPHITKPAPTATVHMITAIADITQFGETAHLNATFPQNGGPIQGTISGDCTGTVHGFYTGDTNGKDITGSATAHCPVLFFDINGTATFSGTVNNDDTSAVVYYTANVSGKSQTGNFTFSLTTQ